MASRDEWIVEPVVPDAKITEYLLNVDHTDGGPKARYFLSHGFSLEKPEPFIEALFQHCIKAHLKHTLANEFTVKYVYEGPFMLRDGGRPIVRSVWQLTFNGLWQSLVTAYRI